MSAENQDNELTDVVLCYQSMGVPLDASPAQIDQMYRALTEEFKKNLSSPDPASREDARRSLVQVKEMLDKITGSVTYHAMGKDYEKTRAAGDVRRPAPKIAVEKSRTMHCPHCNNSIAIGLKACPICKTRIYTTMEKIVRIFFSKTKIIIYFVVLIVAVVAYLVVTRPEIFGNAWQAIYGLFGNQAEPG